jgi:hypothetical protein
MISLSRPLVAICSIPILTSCTKLHHSNDGARGEYTPLGGRRTLVNVTYSLLARSHQNYPPFPPLS